MRKAMISQPMNGKSDEEIYETRDRVMGLLTESGYRVVNTIFTGEQYSDENMKSRGILFPPLRLLAESLSYMSECDTVYFCKGWDKARGCRIEHEAAKAYGLNIIYEE